MELPFRFTWKLNKVKSYKSKNHSMAEEKSKGKWNYQWFHWTEDTYKSKEPDLERAHSEVVS